MGADLLAIIQIDDNTLDSEPPFTSNPSTWDLRRDDGLAGCKPYAFIAAISGVRSSSDHEPLIPCRGLPTEGAATVTDYFDADDPFVGWLTLSELRACLSHSAVDIDSLPRPVAMLLDTMTLAEQRYGTDRVRLVFQICD